MYNKITETINQVMIEYETDNKLDGFWKKPIIKIISARHPEIGGLKKTVSQNHLLPADILSGAESIISFFIPFSENIINSNICGEFASEEWASAYINTNALIAVINNEIEVLLAEKKFKTGKIPATHNFDKEKLISNWSHRHIAAIAGIGTFGINNMLITEAGCCGRLGSLVTDFKFEKYDNTILKEKCLYKINGSCGICRKKCIVNAYETDTFNRHRCYNICLKNGEYHKSTGYADVCGKCVVGLPCSSADPSKKISGFY